MSDSMPLVASTANPQTGNTTAVSSVNGMPDGQASGTGFGELLHASLNHPQQQQADMALMLLEGESLPVFAVSETPDGNNLPQQPLVNWSVLMSWDGGTAEGLPQAQSQLLQGKTMSPVSLLNNQAVTNKRFQPALADGQMLDVGFSQMAEDNKLQTVSMQMLAQQKLLPLEQNLIAASDMPVQGNQHNQLHNLNSIAALSTSASQRADYPVTSQINVPPQHPNWGQALGERMQWMIGQDIHKAELRLDPPELGSLEVQIKVSKEQATVTFSSANAQVREAVESATLRLREMFAEAGLSLGDVNVSQESFSQQREDSTQGAGASGHVRTNGEADGSRADDEQMQHVTVGLLDTYA